MNVRRWLPLTWLGLLVIVVVGGTYSLVNRSCWSMAAGGRAVACPPELPDALLVALLVALVGLGAVWMRVRAGGSRVSDRLTRR